MNFKSSNASKTTVTRDLRQVTKNVGNVYETVVILSKRANQIASEMKEELNTKLQEFSTGQDNLEEIFENREQIEISKFYERLPKPHSIAVQELMENKIYFRRPETAEGEIE